MYRGLLGLLVTLCLVAHAGAAPVAKDKPAADAPAAEKDVAVSPDENPFVLTKDTDVRLDGRPWDYDAIPDDAIVMNMQVASDRRTIVRIQFRSR